MNVNGCYFCECIVLRENFIEICFQVAQFSKSQYRFRNDLGALQTTNDYMSQCWHQDIWHHMSSPDHNELINNILQLWKGAIF